MSFDEWLAFEERHTEIRHELVDGKIFAMSGGSRRHNLLTGNIFAACRTPALADGCQPFVNDLKLRIGDTGYYPDVMVTCDDGDEELYTDTPCLLVEVLSPSTSRTDKREKLGAYLGIASLDAYLLAEPGLVRIEVHQRIEGEWKHFVAGPGDAIALTCPEVTLDVDELYVGVEE